MLISDTQTLERESPTAGVNPIDGLGETKKKKKYDRNSKDKSMMSVTWRICSVYNHALSRVVDISCHYIIKDVYIIIILLNFYSF